MKAVIQLLPRFALILWMPLTHLAAAETLRFKPENPPEMVPLSDRQSPAFKAAKRYLRGVNLADYLEADPRWAITVNPDEYAMMRKEGFDHIRVPIGWHRDAGPGPDYVIPPALFTRVDAVVSNALANDLSVIINIQHFREFDRDPAANLEKFSALWRQIARHYQSHPDQLAFELDNEPHDAATTEVMNPIYARVIREIRETNPRRTVFVEPGRWGNILELKNLVLPDDDNLIVSVHCYDPFLFTHQGTSWAGPDVKVTGFQFPGPPAEPLVPDPALRPASWVRDTIKAYNTLPTAENPISAQTFREKLAYTRAWSDHYGRPVHVGEFGCYVKIDPDSRARYYAAFRKAAEEQGLGWAIWDWSANFRYWDKSAGRPMPGMREALFGK